MNKPELLLVQKRENLIETEFYGFVVFADCKKNISYCGNPQKYPFFHRSCAKPLQAAVADESGTIGYFDLSPEEIAICCGSHTGEKIHVETLKNLLKKGDLDEKDLKCPKIPPLNNFEIGRAHV